MLDSLLALDTELLRSARGLIGIEYALVIEILAEVVVIWGGLILISIWLIGTRSESPEYRIKSLRIFSTIAGVFLLYAIVNLGIPQWRASPQDVVGGIAPLIPRPGDNSFPSGHALFSGALLVGLYRYYRKGWIITITILLSLITVSARVIGGVHYPGDILGGLIIGIIGAIILKQGVESAILRNYIYPFCIKVASWIKL